MLGMVLDGIPDKEFQSGRVGMKTHVDPSLSSIFVENVQVIPVVYLPQGRFQEIHRFFRTFMIGLS